MLFRVKYISLFLVAAFLLSSLGCPDPEEQRERLGIGLINPATGTLAAYGPAMENGVLLAVEEINAAGGVLEHDLEILWRDSRTDPDASRAAAEALVELGVPAIIGAAGSGNTLAVAEVTVPAEVVQITGASTAPSLTNLEDNDFLFRTVGSDAFQGVVLADLLYEEGIRSAAILHLDNAYGDGLQSVISEQFDSYGDATITAIRAFPENAPETHSFQDDLEAVFADNPEALVIVAYFDDGVRILSTWHSRGFGGSVFVTDGMKDSDIAGHVPSDVLDNIKGTAPAFPPGPGYQVFSEAYSSTYGAEPGIFSDTYYDAMMVLGLAIAKAGVAEGPAIRDSMRAVANEPGTEIGPGEFEIGLSKVLAGEDIRYVGASGPIDFDENGDVAGAVEIWQFDSAHEDGITRLRIVEP